MKTFVAVSAVVAAFGIVAACSQGDTHPPYIGDCDACNTTPISTGGDASTDGSKADGSALDSSANDATGNDSSTNDAGNGDGATNDGALLDSGVLD